MAILYINDWRLEVDGAVFENGLGEFNSGDWIATIESGGYKVYHRNDDGDPTGEAISQCFRRSHAHDTEPNASVEPIDTVLKIIPYATNPGANSEQRIIELTKGTQVGSGVGVNAVRTGGTIVLRLKNGGFTLGNITVTAGTEYVLHHHFDDPNGISSLEVYELDGTLVGSLFSEVGGLKNVIDPITGADIGAGPFIHPASGVIEHKIRDIYIFDQSGTAGRTWFGWDYAVGAEQGYSDGSTLEWAVSTGSNHADLIDDWPQNSSEFNDSDDGATTDIEDIFTLPNYTGSREIQAVAFYTLSHANLDAQVHYVFIDDGTRTRGALKAVGSGGGIDSIEIVCFSLAPDGGGWSNSIYNDMEIGYEEFGNLSSLRWRKIATMLLFYIEANDRSVDWEPLVNQPLFRHKRRQAAGQSFDPEPIPTPPAPDINYPLANQPQFRHKRRQAAGQSFDTEPVQLPIIIDIPVATLTLAGLAPVVDTGIDVPVATLTLAGQAPVVDTGIPVPVATLTLTGLAPVVDTGIPVPVAALTLTGLAPVVDTGMIVPVATLTLTGFAPGVNTVIVIPVAALTLTGQAPVVDIGIDVPVAALTLTGLVPTAPIGTPIDVPVATLTLTGLAPVVDTGIIVPVATLSLTGFVPVVDIGIPVPVATLTLTGLAPVVDTGIDVPVATLTLTGLAPVVDTGIDVPVAALTLAGFAPVIDTAIIVPVAVLTLTGFAPIVDFPAAPEVVEKLAVVEHNIVIRHPTVMM